LVRQKRSDRGHDGFSGGKLTCNRKGVRAQGKVMIRKALGEQLQIGRVEGGEGRLPRGRHLVRRRGKCRVENLLRGKKKGAPEKEGNYVKRGGEEPKRRHRGGKRKVEKEPWAEKDLMPRKAWGGKGRVTIKKKIPPAEAPCFNRKRKR